MSRRRPERRIPSRREWPTEVTWEERVADAVDPVFAGDVAHAAGTAWLKVVFALLAFLMVQGVLTALPSSSDLGYGSRSALVLPLVAARAVLLGILPLRTFLTTRADLDPRTREHLLLVGLHPWQIVRGRISGGLALGLWVLALLGPVIAFVVALRGLPMGAGVLLLVAAFLAAATAQAIATGLAAATRGLRPAALPIVAATGVFALLGLSDPDRTAQDLSAFVRFAEDGMWSGLGFVTLVATVALTCGALIAVAAMRRDEHTTTPAFRVLAMATPLVLAAADLLRPGALPGIATPEAPGILAVAWAAFVGVTAVDHDARSPWRPFADGPDRAVVWTLLAVLPIEGAAALVARGIPPWTTHLAMAQLVGFVLLARIVAASAARASAAERVRTARIRAAIAVAAVLVAPRVVNGLQGAPSDSWNATRVVDPAAAALRLTRDGVDAIPWLGLGVGIGVLAIAWIAVAATAPRAFREPDDEPAPVDGPTAETAR